jgi:hypothetical protein
MSAPSTQDSKSDRSYSLFPGPGFPPKQPPFLHPSMPAFSTFGGPCVHDDGGVPSWSRCHIVEINGQLSSYKGTSELDVIKKPKESLPEVRVSTSLTY